MHLSPIRVALAVLGLLATPGAGAQALPAADAVPAELRAASDSYRAAAGELLEYLRTAEHLGNLRQAMVEREVNRDERLKEYRPQLAAHLEKFMDWPSVRADIIEAFATQFSEQDLHAVLDFYRSPVGTKVLMHLERLNQAAFVLGVQRARDNMQELRYRVLQHDQEQAPDRPAATPAAQPPAPEPPADPAPAQPAASSGG